MSWKHRDSELDRTCGKPLPMVRETVFGPGKGTSEPFCARCDGETYEVKADGTVGDEYLYDGLRR